MSRIAQSPIAVAATSRATARRAVRPLPWVSIGVGVVVSVLMRLRMFWSPITSDEGGFLAIARAWAGGDVLYRDVWVDRPQGLLVVFRVWDAVSGGSTASLRILAMIFGAALVVAVGAAATSLAGRHAGAVAAILVAVTSASPVIEGHIANGELLSGTFAVGGFAVGVEALRRQRLQRAPDERLGRMSPNTMLVVSGVLGGLALSIKQSGYEGLLAISVWLVVALVLGWRTPREATMSVLRLGAGTASVIALLALHGAATGFSRWWFAFAGYRLESRSAVTGADWDRFFETARIARPVVWPLLALALAGIVAYIVSRLVTHERGERDRDPVRASSDHRGWLVAIWCGVAAMAFATGGQFHRHYWITLTPALSAAAAVLITRRIRPRVAMALSMAVLIPALVSAVEILRLDSDEIPAAASDDPRPVTDARLARWWDESMPAGEDIYVLCASAAFYAVADEDPPYPYLWQDNVQQVPGALETLRALLHSPAGPDFIAVYQLPDTCDPSGELGRVIAANYRPYTVATGVRILVRDDRTDRSLPI